MRVAFYARVSTQRQAQADGIAQQLERLQAHALAQGWTVAAEDIFRDDGYSGASLKRPGLERLRDRAALRALDRVLITAPDRLARQYVHQVLLLEELAATGCQVEFSIDQWPRIRTISCCCRSAARWRNTSAA
jgi:site-specific DNA recombinase